MWLIVAYDVLLHQLLPAAPTNNKDNSSSINEGAAVVGGGGVVLVGVGGGGVGCCNDDYSPQSTIWIFVVPTIMDDTSLKWSVMRG